MANLIITVIAIALVAIASLMGAYYGGSAFLNNQSAANASTVLNQAQQIAGAWNAYLADNLNVAPTTLAALTTNNYLAQIPVAPAAAGGSGAGQALEVASKSVSVGGAAAATHYFAYADVGVPTTAGLTDPNFSACYRIIKTAKGPTAAAAITTLPSGTSGTIFNGTGGNGTFGCAQNTTAITAMTGSTGTVGATDYVMEYLLQ